MNIRINKNRQAIPLTNGQLSFWYIYQLTKETANHFLPYEFDGVVRPDLVERVINALLQDNEILRTSVNDWCAIQYVCPYEYFHLPYEDLSDLCLDAQSASLGELYLRYCAANFDLVKPPLLRACLVKLAPQKHLLMLVTPHFAMDGAALHQLDIELKTLYQKANQGLSLRTASKLALADYVAQEQAARLAQSVKAREFWAKQLESIKPTYLASSLVDISDRSRRGVFIPLKQAQLSLIGRWCGTFKLTQQMVFLALIGKVMSDVTGNQHLCLTTVQENRDIEGARDLYGAMLTSLPVPMQIAQGQSLNELFLQVKQTTLAVYQYRHVPWSIPLSIVAQQKLDKTPWWLSLFKQTSGLYHTLTKQAGLYPQALFDFAAIAAGDIEEDKKIMRDGAQHQALTINVNMLPSFYEQTNEIQQTQTTDNDACQITLRRELDFPPPPDNSEWEQSAINFYIEKHAVNGFGIRLSHQCLTPQAEQLLRDEFYALLDQVTDVGVQEVQSA
ncbi:hypothetical protein PSECIP111951_00432 [Pseudoalteromonas holothuriae]|uniref:Condensation domain-containing protein n=1 Tax=Pseudoalteromonas holothuriae TaxID=2963714 RepID=A0A9W4QR43_9GAMM|nr:MULTISPECIES: condensation domain-containing protein [unclassified Pseudoalteromonas]CAH9049680.1 hypothetical protein PSECIP111854_00327 [Pseudoalteromonas sp. CIP111854]CAH9051625.1 hypothetical protein PSECIP111951_00432 [Pseudoalteromonas sp. CIP111951]